jgi:1-pyrroline-5-carboxylate dehydrogenase
MIVPADLPDQRNYAPGSAERAGLQAAVEKMISQAPFEVPCIVDGKEVKTGNLVAQPMPHDHANALCNYHSATPEIVQAAIDGALKGKNAWEELPWADRAAIFLKAADLISGKYRYELMAATMLGQGKNAWQAEIDAAAEVSDYSLLKLARSQARRPAQC